jgi:hypothetical protein
MKTMKVRKLLALVLAAINCQSIFLVSTLAAETNEGGQRVEEVIGQVYFYDEVPGTFSRVKEGMMIEKSTLFSTGQDSEMIFSCVGKIAARVSENAQFVLSPLKKGRYEVELRKGTITASLDPNRPAGSPLFAVRTFSGITEAKGTLFAVAEYKGQTYTAVKKGEVKKKTNSPTKPDFSAYLNAGKLSKSNLPSAFPSPSSKR